MRKKEKEKYPKKISFYLEEKEKEKRSVSVFFNFCDKENPYNNQKKNQKNNYDDISKSVQFVYFHQNFKRKADLYMIEDKQKEMFLNYISDVRSHSANIYIQEKLKIYNNFIYCLFTSANKELKIKISFCFFFEKTPRKIPYSTYIEKIYYFDIWKEKDAPDKNINKIIQDFERNFGLKNNDLEYDKMISLGEDKNKLLYLSQYYNGEPIYVFFPFELKTRNEIYKKIKIFEKEYFQGFELSIWDLKFPINNVLNKISNINKFNYNAFFEKDVLDFHPSKTETNLINMNNNFILSGRPGTGKTVIILIKIIMCFLRCLYEHSSIINGKPNFDYMNQILENLFNENNEEFLIKEEDNDVKKIDTILNDNKPFNVLSESQVEDENSIIENSINENENNNSIEEEDSNSESTSKITIEDNLGSEGSTYKIIFTSLSQSLCAFAENAFIRGLKKSSKLKCQINPTNQKIYEKMSSFVGQKKYPLFLNFRKLIFMIDGSLNFQFFDRPNKNQLKKRQEDCDIRYYPDCQYDVMVNLSFLVYRPGNIYFYRREYLEDPKIMTEINEDTFYNHFNSIIKSNKILNNDKNHISAYEVYSNIISIIKGSIKSYLVGAISLEDYLSTGKKICPFNKEQKKEIYKIFEQYETWKLTNKYFDFQDVVNYLIREVNIELVPQNRKIFDLVFIDEVQDFSINQLYLLFLISRDIKVLAGDTCQTLSKINTFRFSDLNNVLYTFSLIKNIKIKEPKNIEINLNFRCQANILKFAHLIYEMIKCFFSNTLDKVRMDFSTQVGSGEKPYIIPYEIEIKEDKKKLYKNLNLGDFKKHTGLDYFLKGITDNNLFLDNLNSLINISFSVNHCIICRNDDIVKSLNKKYNNKVFCSTAFESKGLEYEIVILYNFFKDSLPFVREIWSYVLKNIKVTQVENNYLYLLKQNLDFEDYSPLIKDQIYALFNQKFNIELINDFTEQFSIYNFCSELKELYVAITRAKSRLYIYEEDTDMLRLFMQKIFNYDIISQEVFLKKSDEDNSNKFKLILNKEDNYNLLNKKVIGCLKFINNSRLTKENLLKKAYDEFNQDNEYNYKKAFYLFQVLNEDLMTAKCQINMKYIESQKLKGSDNPEINNQFINLNQEIFDLIQKINYDDKKQIKGEVLINLKKYEEALKYFMERNNHKKCGIVLIKMEEYQKALTYFIKGKEYSFAINCLIELKNYEKLYDFLLQYKDEFDLEHIQYFYKITCDKFFQKFMIPFKQNKKGFKSKNIKFKNCDEEKKYLGGKFKVIFNNSDNNIEKKIYFDEENNFIVDNIKNKKIKIKNPFILISQPNSDIFDLDNYEQNKNIFSIVKTKKEIIWLINTFKSFLNFMSVYLQIIISKTIKNSNQELFIKNTQEIIKDIDNKMSKENLDDNELINIMENLVIKKHEFKVIIIGILKNIEAKQYIYDLYEIYIFKIKILEHIKNDLPIVYTKAEGKIDKDLISQETIKQLTEYSKYLPLKEEIIIKYFKDIFHENNNLEAIIGLIKKNDIIPLLDLSFATKKIKIVEFLFKTLNIDFIKGTNNSKAFKNIKLTKLEILNYLNNYIRLLLSKFFEYYFQENPDNIRMNKICEKMKNFPQLFEILKSICIRDNSKEFNLNSFINDINEVFNLIKNKDLNMKQYLELISICNEVDLIKNILRKNIILFDFNITNNTKENSKILNSLMINYSKIIDINIDFININDDKRNEIDNINNSLYEYEKEKIDYFYLYLFSEVNWNEKYFSNFNAYFKKIEIFKKINLDKAFEESYYRKYLIYDALNLSFFQRLLSEQLLVSLMNDNKEDYISQKYFYFLDNEQEFNFDEGIEFNEILINFDGYFYEGEYCFKNEVNEIYESQGKIIVNILKNYTNIISDFINNKNTINKNRIINYILFTNLIGGRKNKIDYDVVINKYKLLFEKDKNLKSNFLKKDFSYLEAFNIINDNYSSGLNQILIIIWIRKLLNIFFCFFYDDENNKENNIKLYINENSPDIKLNIYEIQRIAHKSDNKNNNFNFINEYLTLISSFIKNIQKNKSKGKCEDIMNNYFSQIFYSLETFSSVGKIKAKIEYILNEMKNASFLLNKDKNQFKEVYIIFDENIKKEIFYFKIVNLCINLNEDEDEDDDQLPYSDENDSQDYDEIEDTILKKKKIKKDYY